MFLVLSGITLFASLALSTVYVFTKDPIALSKMAKKQNAIKSVLPPFDHFDSKPIVQVEGTEITKIYRAFDKSNTFVGSAVEATTSRGYKGGIEIIVGFDKSGVIKDYFVLEQNETPGLGAKMVNWFKTNKGKQNILGLNPGETFMTVKEVDAITAATISSKAFLGAVQNAYNAYSMNIPE